jgi:hypothetical protein
LFFHAWWNFGDGGSSTWRMADEFNKGDVMERIKKGIFQKLDIKSFSSFSYALGILVVNIV